MPDWFTHMGAWWRELHANVGLDAVDEVALARLDHVIAKFDGVDKQLLEQIRRLWGKCRADTQAGRAMGDAVESLNNALGPYGLKIERSTWFIRITLDPWLERLQEHVLALWDNALNDRVDFSRLTVDGTLYANLWDFQTRLLDLVPELKIGDVAA